MTTKTSTDGVAIGDDNVSVPKKRVRIVKKDTERIYSATQDQGERYDSVEEEKAHKRAAAAAAKDEKTAAIHALESEVLVPPRKNRGRPSKAYIEAQRAYEEALARRQSEIEEAKAALAGQVVFGDDAEATPEDVFEEGAENLVETQEKEVDDVPEFIRMQQTDGGQEHILNVDGSDEEMEGSEDAADLSEASVSTDKTETITPEISPLAPEQSLAESVQTTDTAQLESTAVSSMAAAPQNAECITALENIILPDGRSLAQAYDDGDRFIIIQDVPFVDPEGYQFTMPSDSISDAQSQASFRRFKEDMGVSASAGVIAQAKQLIAGPNPLRGQSLTESSVPVAQTMPEVSQPAPLRVNELTVEAEGVLELDNQGVGYLRSADYNYMPSPDDVFVAQNQVRAYSLKMGDLVKCVVRTPKDGEKNYVIKEILSINGCSPISVRDRISFEHLTPLFPDEQFRLCKKGEKAPFSCRIVDLFSPIGKGQRALIVAPPKTGKTILMKQVANAIAANYPDTYLMMLLIDERPEEVTDMARTVNAEVIASTFDEPAKRHVRIANMVLEKAKRMVECGRDVVIFLDSITRLARAFNTEAPASGKILTGGVDAYALQKPKRFFGAARNIEGGGSLTIIATALIDTGSKMDEVIFEEFKGTGNMELVLDRGLANKRIFPAVNLVQSSTRREDLLLDELTVNRMFITRGYMADMNPVEAMNFLRKHLDATISNEEFIATIGTQKG